LTPTSLKDLKADLSTAIEATTPTEKTGHLWRDVGSGDPWGLELRRFRLDFEPTELEEVEGESIFAGGNTWATIMRVVCSYTAREITEEEWIIDADARDLWHRLDSQVPSITGAVYVGPPTWVDAETSEDGDTFGWFEFLVRFLAPDGA